MRQGWIFGLVGLVVGALIVGGVIFVIQDEERVPERRAPKEPAGKIAFLSAGNAHTIRPDGTDETRLIEGQWGIFSPDGKLAFYSRYYEDVAQFLYIFNVRDGTTTQVPGVRLGAHVIDSPSWSPDRERVAFSVFGTLWVVNVDGTQAVTLAEAERRIKGVAFSPDGTKIAYFVVREGLYVMNSDGTNNRKLFATGPRYMGFLGLSWSPDGSRVAFSPWGPIYVVDMYGRGITVAGGGADPKWSPDGKRIAYIPFGQDPTIHLVNPDGTGRKSLELGLSVYGFDWSPCGRMFALCTRGTIYVANTDGTSLRRLVHGTTPQWVLSP
jgi:Tol biopolymer transport system component